MIQSRSFDIPLARLLEFVKYACRELPADAKVELNIDDQKDGTLFSLKKSRQTLKEGAEGIYSWFIPIGSDNYEHPYT